jgi:predicted SnoaL-like aldol condensation-catalyzing enzyme
MKQINLVLLMSLVLTSGAIYAQSKKKMNRQEVVEQFLNGFNDPSKITSSLALLTDDYEFKNPMVHLHSKEEFIALASEIGKVLTGLEIIRMADNGRWVAVSYEFKSEIPGLESNLATEWFLVKKGKIRESHLIYDASEWRKFYAEMKN